MLVLLGLLTAGAAGAALLAAGIMQQRVQQLAVHSAHPVGPLLAVLGGRGGAVGIGEGQHPVAAAGRAQGAGAAAGREASQHGRCMGWPADCTRVTRPSNLPQMQLCGCAASRRT